MSARTAGMMLAHFAVRTCVSSTIIEFDSRSGADSAPAFSNCRSMMRRFCMSGVRRQSGRLATSFQVTRSREPWTPSIAVSRR